MKSAVFLTPTLFRYMKIAFFFVSSLYLGSVSKKVFLHSLHIYLCFPSLLPFFFISLLLHLVHCISIPSPTLFISLYLIFAFVSQYLFDTDLFKTLFGSFLSFHKNEHIQNRAKKVKSGRTIRLRNHNLVIIAVLKIDREKVRTNREGVIKKRKVEEKTKNGFKNGAQRYKCKTCGCNYTRSTPHGYRVKVKREVLIYYLEK